MNKFALAEQTEARIKEMEEKKLALETRKVDLDELTKRLGSSALPARTSDPCNWLMDKYASGNLGAAETTMVNNAIDMLTTRETIVDSDGNTRKTGGAIQRTLAKRLSPVISSLQVKALQIWLCLVIPHVLRRPGGLW